MFKLVADLAKLDNVLKSLAKLLNILLNFWRGGPSFKEFFESLSSGPQKFKHIFNLENHEKIWWRLFWRIYEDRPHRPNQLFLKFFWSLIFFLKIALSIRPNILTLAPGTYLGCYVLGPYITAVGNKNETESLYHPLLLSQHQCTGTWLPDLDHSPFRWRRNICK